MNVRLDIIFVVLFFTHSGFADHNENPRPNDAGEVDLNARVKAIMDEKCTSCHSGGEDDKIFDESGFPRANQRQAVLNAIHHSPHAKRPMPPSRKAQLTAEEMELIDQWASQSFGIQADVCHDNPPVPKVFNEILRDRCLFCHSTAKQFMRPSYKNFINPDGSIDFSQLGDASEADIHYVSERRTALSRMLEEITGYYMPPRGDKLKNNRMTETEVTYVSRILNKLMHQEDCTPREITPVVFTSTGKPFETKFADATKSCASIGMRLPTMKQLRDSMERVQNSTTKEGCVWSTTFEAGREDFSHKKPVKRKMVYWNSSVRGEGSATEDFSCKVVCVK